MRLVVLLLLLAAELVAGIDSSTTDTARVTTAAQGVPETTPAPAVDSGVVIVYEVACDVSVHNTTDCPQHDLSVTRVASTGSSSSEWPGSYIAVVVLLFLLVIVLMGLVIAVYVRQQQGYSQVGPTPGDYSQAPPGYYGAEAGQARKTIGVELVRTCVPEP